MWKGYIELLEIQICHNIRTYAYQRRADTILALLNLFTLIAYFCACLASKEPSMKRLWCWRVPRMLVVGVLIDITVLYVS